MDECRIGSDGEVAPTKPMLYIGANGVQPVPYTNDKGETAIRNIMPVTLYFGSNEWHPEEQWLLVAWDTDEKALRTFSLKGFKDGNDALTLSLPTRDDLPVGLDSEYVVPTKEVGTIVPEPNRKPSKRKGNRDALEDD